MIRLEDLYKVLDSILALTETMKAKGHNPYNTLAFTKTYVRQVKAEYQEMEGMVS